MKYYEYADRQRMTIEDWLELKYKVGEDRGLFITDSKGQCPPLDFCKRRKLNCFYCEQCKMDFYDNIKHDRRSKFLQYRKTKIYEKDINQ